MKVIVIGSGLLGLVSAYALSRRGHEVVVLDRQTGPGRETSFANGALLTPGMAEPWNAPGSWRVLLGSIGRSDAALQLRLGALPGMAIWGMAFLRHSTAVAFHRNWRSNLRLALYSHEAMQALREAAGIEYGRQATGALKLYRDAGDLERTDNVLQRAPVDSMRIRRLTAAETVSMEPALAPIAGALAGALYYPLDEVGDAHAFCERLAEHCRAQGVDVRYGMRVSLLARRGNRLTAVEAEGAHFEADHYVFAAGSYTAPLLRSVGVKLPVQPAKGYTVTIDDDRARPSLRIPVIDDAMHAAIVPLPGALRVAGTAEFAGYDLALRPERVDNLLKLVRAVLPQAPLDFASARPWCGLRAMTPDGVPIIGRTALDNVWVNTGHGHLGWTLAAGSGPLLADLMTDRNPAFGPRALLTGEVLTMIRVFDADQIRALAPMPRLVAALEEAFRAGHSAPARQVVGVPGGAGERLFLAMPAFDRVGRGAVKLATYFPDNAASSRPTIQAAIVVFSESGTPIALLDGTIVTQLRTGAASALASRYLSRPEGSQLVIIGTGAQAPFMAAAHAAVRPLRRISVCGRSAERAVAAAAAIRAMVTGDIEVVASPSAEEAVGAADIVSCATSSPVPVLFGRWLRPGTFVDLVGSFSPSKREADDEAVCRARIFVDTFEGTLSEAGDLLDPLARGVITRERIEGELADLVSGRIVGRRTSDEITLFKSVGTAIEDLAAAQMIVAAAEK